MRPLRLIGRCELFGEIGSGGMATVHLGRIAAAGGFAKIVAVKRMHEQLSKDPQFVAMFLDEARLVARIKHPNVRPTLDLIDEEGELFIVMEYVAGVSLRRLFFEMSERGQQIPPEIAVHIVCGVLHGLHAAHNAHDSDGSALELVHRDVSPENILVGSDGMARLLDFGMAKAMGRLHLTQPGLVKGKLTVMAPEQVQGKEVSRRTDVFATGVVLWQALTAKRLILGEHIAEVAHNVLNQEFEPPSSIVDWLPPQLDRVVMKALARDPAKRWESAEKMAMALEAGVKLATQREVAEWIHRIGGDILEERASMVAAIERSPVGSAPEARPSGAEAGSSGQRYAWVTGAVGSARRAIDDARTALAARVERDANGRIGISATVRRVVTAFPGATIAASLTVVVALVAMIVAVTGEESAPAREEAVAPSRSKPRPAVTASATASAKKAARPVGPWVTVPAGEFMFGCNTWADRLCGPDEMPPTRVHVDAFQIERTEVTVKAYRACVEAGACSADNLDSHGVEEVKLDPIDKCNYGREGRDDHPVNCLSYEQAAAYCRHVGGRLPTEAEWEKAAGGADAWPYPTGDATISCEKAVMSESGDGCGRGTSWPVGSKEEGTSPFGAVDMAGNVREWTADYYESSHRGVVERNPPGPAEGTLRVTRGGSWRDAAARLLRTSARFKTAPTSHAIELGFRCAKDDTAPGVESPAP